MSTGDDPDTAELVRRAGAGDEDASRRLLVRSRARLRRMVAVRLDQRVLARIDPSDVVQEVLLDASQRLVDYSRHPRIPFYAWLHRLAKDRLATVHELHIQTQKRSVNRERSFLPDRSANLLAGQLLDPRSGPSQQFLRKERQQCVQEALAQLEPQDQEILVMRHLEQMSISEIAAVLDLSEGAVKMRRLRAIQRLLAVLDCDLPGSSM